MYKITKMEMTDDPKPKKGITRKKKAVDACANGDSCDTKATIGRSKGFSNKSRYNLPKSKTIPVAEDSQSTHMNMRDLGGNSGDVSYYGRVNTGSGSADEGKFKKMEIGRTKTKKFFGK